MDTADLSLGGMFALQRALLDKHPEWGPHNPAVGRSQLLWMIAELGEVIDIIKKKPEEKYMLSGDPARAHLVEEFADVLMYFIDALDCFGVTPEEISAEFVRKNAFNMVRDFTAADAE